MKTGLIQFDELGVFTICDEASQLVAGGDIVIYNKGTQFMCQPPFTGSNWGCRNDTVPAPVNVRVNIDCMSASIEGMNTNCPPDPNVNGVCPTNVAC